MSPVIDCTSEEGLAEGIAAAAEAVRGGEVVVLPTDTVYGVGVDAFSSDAVAAVLMAKGRGRGMALCAPLAPGATERARAFVADAYHRDEFTASRRRLHVSEELLTLQSTPQGDIVGLYIEGDDPVKGNAGFAASQDPFDLWFKEELTKIFPPAIDWSKPVEGVEEIFDSTKVADLSLGKAA